MNQMALPAPSAHDQVDVTTASRTGCRAPLTAPVGHTRCSKPSGARCATCADRLASQHPSSTTTNTRHPADTGIRPWARRLWRLGWILEPSARRSVKRSDGEQRVWHRVEVADGSTGSDSSPTPNPITARRTQARCDRPHRIPDRLPALHRARIRRPVRLGTLARLRPSRRSQSPMPMRNGAPRLETLSRPLRASPARWRPPRFRRGTRQIRHRPPNRTPLPSHGRHRRSGHPHPHPRLRIPASRVVTTPPPRPRRRRRLHRIRHRRPLRQRLRCRLHP